MRLQRRQGGSWRAGGTGVLQRDIILNVLFILCLIMFCPGAGRVWHGGVRDAVVRSISGVLGLAPRGPRHAPWGHAEVSPGMILVITAQAVSQGGGVFFNPAGVLSFSKSLSCFQLCPSSCAGVTRDGCRAFCPSFSPGFPSPPARPLLQMPGGRRSPCHPTTAARSLPVPLGLPFCSASKGCPRSASSLPLSAL